MPKGLSRTEVNITADSNEDFKDQLYHAANQFAQAEIKEAINYEAVMVSSFEEAIQEYDKEMQPRLKKHIKKIREDKEKDGGDNIIAFYPVSVTFGGYKYTKDDHKRFQDLCSKGPLKEWLTKRRILPLSFGNTHRYRTSADGEWINGFVLGIIFVLY